MNMEVIVSMGQANLDTVEVWGSSPHVPTILSIGIERIAKILQPVIPARELLRLGRKAGKILTCKITCKNPVLAVLTRTGPVPDLHDRWPPCHRSMMRVVPRL